MADKRISQLIERTDIANNDVLPIVASGATTTNKVTISTIQTWMQDNLDVGVTSVGLSMPSAFVVSNSPVTASGNITVTGAGTVSQYIRGDGSLADFPQSGGGGGASVNYYLNGSVSQGTIGGIAYYEMNKTPILGAGTNFTIAADGYIASFITDGGDPGLLLIPAGNWNFETYLSASSGGGSPTFYIELYKVSSSGTATLIASNSGTPESISLGTNINPYFSALAVPATNLLITDRLALRYYVTHAGRTITLHTENSHLCQIITTFTTGLTALNGLTAQVQFFATGTQGVDFNIISSGSNTHTFNIPSASATDRGLVTTGSQVFGGVKTFDSGIKITNGLSTAIIYSQSGTDTNTYQFPTSSGFLTTTSSITSSGIAKFNAGNQLLAAVAGTDYVVPSALNAYVPYTGATTNVDLGSNTLSSRNLIANGGFNTGALLLKNANNASLINTGYFTLTPSSTNTSINFGFSTGASTWKSFTISSHLLTDNTPTIYSLPNGGGTLAVTTDLNAYLPLGGGTLTGPLNGTSATFSGEVITNNGTNSTNGIKVVSSLSSSLFTGGIEFIRTSVTAGSKIEPVRDAAIGGVGLKFMTTANNAAESSGTYSTPLTLASTGAATFSSSVQAGGNVLVPAGSGLAFTGDATRIMTPEDNVSGALIQTPGIIRFNAGGTTPRMTILANGNVGIGPASPGYRLDVLFNNTTNADIFRAGMTGVSNGFTVQRVSSNFRYLFNDGNVGIGDSPSTRLTVSGGYSNFTDGTVNIYLGSDGTGGLFGTVSNHYQRFVTNDTERMRITSDTSAYLRMASGTGGIQFNGDTAAANALDDYEEGTWTPTIGGTWITNPTSLSGLYTKIGNMVYIRLEFTGGLKATSTSGWIDSLPFSGAVGGGGTVSNVNVENKGIALLDNSTRVWLTELDFNGLATKVMASYRL